jgi:hypothetical protein
MIDCVDNSHDHEELRAPAVGVATPTPDYSASPMERVETTLARLTSKTPKTYRVLVEFRFTWGSMLCVENGDIDAQIGGRIAAIGALLE